MAKSGLADQYERQDRWRRWDDALSRVPLSPGQRVLDLGCGVGQVTARLARLGAAVIGVDRDHDLIDVARARHPGVRFEHGDVTELTPTTFGRVDGVTDGMATPARQDGRSPAVPGPALPRLRA